MLVQIISVIEIIYSEFKTPHLTSTPINHSHSVLQTLPPYPPGPVSHDLSIINRPMAMQWHSASPYKITTSRMRLYIKGWRIRWAIGSIWQILMNLRNRLLHRCSKRGPMKEMGRFLGYHFIYFLEWGIWYIGVEVINPSIIWRYAGISDRNRWTASYP